MSIYTDKTAYLVSLIEQLKRYPFDDLPDLLEIAHVEYVLDISSGFWIPVFLLMKKH